MDNKDGIKIVEFDEYDKHMFELYSPDQSLNNYLSGEK